MRNAMRLFAVMSVAFMLSACGGSADLGSTSAPAASNKNVSEQARLKLFDACMFDPATNVGANDKKGKAPVCQCYSQGVSKQMSASDAANYVSNGGMSWSVKSSEIMAACKTR